MYNVRTRHAVGRGWGHRGAVASRLGGSSSASLSLREKAWLVGFLHWSLGNRVLRNAYKMTLVGMASQKLLHFIIISKCVLDPVGQGVPFVSLKEKKKLYETSV